MTDFSDIKNPRVAQLLKSYEERLMTDNKKKYQIPGDTFPDSENQIYGQILRKKRKATVQYLQTSTKNKWLKKKGKGYLIDFDLRQRKQLRNFFNMLDKKSKGYIGLDELEDMLLSLGLASKIEEVKQMMATVDEDHSGKIQFEQFLQMIQDQSVKYNGLVQFFKQLIIARRQNTKNIKNLKEDARLRKKLNYHSAQTENKENYNSLIKEQLAGCPRTMPFQMIVNQVRRSYILSSLNIGRLKNSGIGSSIRIKKGKQVVVALQKMEERRLIRSYQTSSNFFSRSN